MPGIELIYHDDDLLVLNKPSGLLSVPGKKEAGIDSLQARAQAEFSDALIVHRLDMSTSGILIMARGKESQRILNRSFSERLIYKEYFAVVDGMVAPRHGVISLPIIKDWPNRPKQRVDYLRGKSSETHFIVLNRDSVQNNTRLKLLPITGRSHQLRLHMQCYGHAIIGDELYGSDQIRDKANRLLLHAHQIQFEHPRTRKCMTFRCEVPF
jgi:tRNA pseudouridine32 synthase/23S rRNA pseudouridine746 synthase